MKCCLNLILYLGIVFVVQSQPVIVETNEVRDVVKKWNDFHSIQTVGRLSELYAERVHFYGQELSVVGVIAIKKSALEASPEFVQSLGNDLNLSAYSTGIVRCDFTKTVVRRNGAKTYHGILLLKRKAFGYEIVGESDEQSETIYGFKKSIGERVAILPRENDRTDYVQIDKTKASISSQSDDNNYTGLTNTIVGLAVLSVGALLFLRRRKERRRPATPPSEISDSLRIGKDFEKFVIGQFDIYNKYFRFIEWRSDNSHLGIVPEANKFPDLVYEYRYEPSNFIRRFAVECKYRSGDYQKVRILKEHNLVNYKRFQHEQNIPVYIALGLKGTSNDPEDLYLIPLDSVQLEMTKDQLRPYRKARRFFYDMVADRLT
jgi:hypothetical protein